MTLGGGEFCYLIVENGEKLSSSQAELVQTMLLLRPFEHQSSCKSTVCYHEDVVSFWSCHAECGWA